MSTTTRRFDHRMIAKIRKRKGLTQIKLAEKSGVPLDTLRQYEQGKAMPSVERLFIIADTLGCRADDFTGSGASS
jgi:transcriptional regulator with XRE-family HTH domain